MIESRLDKHSKIKRARWWKIGAFSKLRHARPADWRVDVTLCIAATCKDKGLQKIVLSADKRLETGWAGADVGFKFNWASAHWPALMAGEMSTAEDLLATYRTVLDGIDLEQDKIIDKFNEASSAHKEKLCERFLRMQLGISYERFLSKGAVELSPDVFRQMLFEIRQISFKCELLIVGFIGSKPYIFCVDESGCVSQCHNFGAIGTGSIIAQSVLYQREQYEFDSLEKTMYGVYEAAKHAQIAPGVGETNRMVVIQPKPELERGVEAALTTPQCIDTLEKYFQEYGPRSIGTIADFGSTYFRILGQTKDSTPSTSQASEPQRENI